MHRRKPVLFSTIGSAIALAAVGFLGHEVRALRVRAAEDRSEIQAMRRTLEEERAERAALESRSSELGRRASELERALDQARAAVDASGDDLGASLRKVDFALRAVDSRQGRLEQRVEALAVDMAAALRRVDEEAADITFAKKRLNAIAPEDFSALLSPTVKISSKTDVGSGTVVYSGKHGGKYLTYVLTAHHIVEQNWDPKNPVPLECMTYRDGRKVREDTGVVVAVNAQVDLALIEMQTDTPYESVAKMIAPERAPEVRLYSRVHALGCPLGYSPIPTSGDLTSKNKVLDGHSYWMINAPTIFGNSGGGIYLADTGEMIGILSRISAYKNLIDVAVPHMGIVTAMPDIYEWLAREHYQFIFDGKFTYEECGRARLAERSGSGGGTMPVSGAVPAGTASGMKVD
jgi:hypothetical protein